MKIPFLQIATLLASYVAFPEFACSQARWQGAELFNEMHAQGYRQTDSTRFQRITFRQWQGHAGRRTTASMYMIGGTPIHLPDKDLLEELTQRGLREAQQWIEIDTRSWNLTEEQQNTLHLAAELQLRATMRRLRSNLKYLSDVDLKSPESVPALQESQFVISEALDPRFRDRECLYYRMLMKMKH